MFKQIASAVFRITYASLTEPTIVTNKGEPIATYVPWGAEYAVVKVAETPRSTESDVGGGGSTAAGQSSPSTAAPRRAAKARAGGGSRVSAPSGYSKAQQTGRPTK
jgi:hypothetical protein